MIATRDVKRFANLSSTCENREKRFLKIWREFEDQIPIEPAVEKEWFPYDEGPVASILHVQPGEKLRACPIRCDEHNKTEMLGNDR